MRWSKNEPLTPEEKRIVETEYVRVRRGISRDGIGDDMPGVNFWYEWPPNGPSRLENLKLKEITDDRDMRLICFSLYRELLEDVQAIGWRDKHRPRICALEAQGGMRQKPCNNLFRPGEGAGGWKYCSKRCGEQHRNRIYRMKKRGRNLPMV